ncbi:hypothetical protein PGB25_15990 (plasmid) [Lactiplantibacillus plantarum]|nr:hypothetical protein [Lactiplantibacillus plantarum]WCE45084.1 hypothetical protein PGB25_15990 [Lactiplantibacillus plantarum]
MNAGFRYLYRSLNRINC